MITEFYFYRFLKIQKASGQPIYQQHRQHAEYWGVCWSHTIIVSIGRSNRGSRSSPKFSRFSPKFWPCHGVLTCWLGWSAETYSCRLNRQVKVNNIKTNRISPEPTHYRFAPLQGHIKSKKNFKSKGQVLSNSKNDESCFQFLSQLSIANPGWRRPSCLDWHQKFGRKILHSSGMSLIFSFFVKSFSRKIVCSACQLFVCMCL